MTETKRTLTTVNRVFVDRGAVQIGVRPGDTLQDIMDKGTETLERNRCVSHLIVQMTNGGYYWGEFQYDLRPMKADKAREMIGEMQE